MGLRADVLVFKHVTGHTFGWHTRRLPKTFSKCLSTGWSLIENSLNLKTSLGQAVPVAALVLSTLPP